MGLDKNHLGHAVSILEDCPPWIIGGHALLTLTDVRPCHGINVLVHGHLEEVLLEVHVHICEPCMRQQERMVRGSCCPRNELGIT